MTAQIQNHDEELESIIRQEEVRMLYESIPFSLLASPIISLAIFAIFYGHSDSTHLLITWVILVFVIAIARGLDTWQYYRTEANLQKKNIWGTRFLTGTVMAGMCWGALPWLAHSSSGEYQALIVITIVGITSGSMSTLSYRWQTIAYFLIPALGLLELRLIIENDSFFTAISFLLLLFIFFTLAISRKIYKNTNQNVRLRIEADFRERALIEAKEEAERANLAKSNFLSRMSHDLRTPLNAILGFAQLLKYDKDINQSQLANTEEITAAGKHLLDLVNQILDLAKIEKGKLRVHLKRIWLKDMLASCHSLLKPMAAEKNIDLDFDICPGIYINADKTRLKQILLNLLSNAIKYNYLNGTVSLRCTSVTDHRIRIEIHDSGTGIPLKLQEHLFQPFSRLETETSLHEGTGIGLSISKHLTEIMGGEIGFESLAGRGSTFWIVLDGGISEKDIKNQQTSIDDEFIPGSLDVIEANAGTRILVAEDNITNRKLIASQLNALGYHFDLASDGKEALILHEKHDYNIIITDCNMPVMDGYQLANKIRGSGDIRTPIIALTADAFPESEIRCRNSGMNDRMVKPVTLKNLKTTIKKWQHVSTTH